MKNPSKHFITSERKKRESHGMTHTRLYEIYKSMKYRCSCSSNSSYKGYGAKGLTVCSQWESSFLSFYNWSIKNGYKDDLTIDRINNDKGYSPENCRWVTQKEQCRNMKTNVLLTYNNKTQCAAAWGDELGIDRYGLYRAKKRGLSDADAIEHCIGLKRRNQ